MLSTIFLSEEEIYSQSLFEYQIHLFRTALEFRIPLEKETLLEENNFKEAQHLWETIPRLRLWFNGNSVNFADEGKEEDWDSISWDIKLTFFDLAISHGHSDIALEMWKKNPLLQSWYCGEAIYVNKTDKEKRSIYPKEIFFKFQITLAHEKLFPIASTLWNKNKTLQTLCMGDELSLEKKIEIFDLAFYQKQKDIVNKMLAKTPSLQSWCYKGEVKFLDRKIEKKYSVSWREFLKKFELALDYNWTNITLSIWKSHSLLQAWYTRKPLEFIQEEKTETRLISLKTHINIFDKAFSSSNYYIIQELWKESLEVRRWYRGESLEFILDENQVAKYSLTEKALFEKFEKAIDMIQTVILQDMLKNNSKLANIIKFHNQDKEIGKRLLLKIIKNNCWKWKGSFLTDYLSCVDNKEVLADILKKIEEDNQLNAFLEQKKRKEKVINLLRTQIETINNSSLIIKESIRISPDNYNSTRLTTRGAVNLGIFSNNANSPIKNSNQKNKTLYYFFNLENDELKKKTDKESESENEELKSTKKRKRF